MSILGTRVVRTEDPRFLTSGGRYAADLGLEGAVHAVFVRSTTAHGVIESIDIDEALEAPGVLGVFLAGDLETAPISNPDSEHQARPAIASERVRYAGEVIAVVVAETYAQGLDAAELIWAEIEPLDAVPTIEAGLQDDVLLFPERGTNINSRHDDEALDFSGCEVVVEADIVNSRMNGSPIETRVAAAAWAGDQLTCWTSTQGAHPAKNQICRVLGLEHENVHVITTDVGGSFGSRAGPGPEECVLGALAKIVQRPVVWAETRTENLMAMGHARSQNNWVKLGGTSDGTLTHFQLDIVQEAGAYPEASSFLPYFTRIMTTGVYDIANASTSWRTVATTTPPLRAFRGAGRPEATATLERAIDLLATEIGLDPADIRRRNMLRPEQFPFTTPMGQVYDSGEYARALDQALEAADYESLRQAQAAARTSGASTMIGIGIASYVEITAPNPTPAQSESGRVVLEADGTITAYTGSTPYGQGHETTWAMIVSDRMGVPMDKVTVVWGDTDKIASSNITGGSRSVQLAGSAMADATDRLIDAAKDLAASSLEAAPEDIVFDRVGGVFHVAGTPGVAVDWPTVATSNPGLEAISQFGQNGATFPFGTHVAVVEVDTETGGVKLVRMVTVDDAGTLINPLIAEGQVHGGLAAGVSQALFEEVVYDEFGNLVTSNFGDYALPAASEFPSFEVTLTETP
ncbi:MAG: xanthine dehydrogenase family protein, partial [Acidimicrobiales bacterium]|nr:xanthine dehydrogenase family protein [Acidimicrobiales bacterium]